MNSNVEILDDIDKVTMAARNDFNQKNLKNTFLTNGIGRNFKLLARKFLCDSCSIRLRRNISFVIWLLSRRYSTIEMPTQIVVENYLRRLKFRAS